MRSWTKPIIISILTPSFMKKITIALIAAAITLWGCSKASLVKIDLHDATEVSEASAIISATVNLPDEVRLFSFDYGTDKNNLDQSIGLLFTKTGEYSAKLNMLEPGMTYYYLPVVTTRENELRGEIRSFTTKSFTPTSIDLGLSVKWGSTNVGAFKPEEPGYYYAWGEIEPKDSYSWGTYKWMQKGMADPAYITKYHFPDTRYTCTWYDSFKNFIGDGKKVLDPEDDVATVKWGKPWRTPTWTEYVELMEKCTWTWGQINGQNGYTIKGPNGNTIFLPAAGCKTSSTVNSHNLIGCYWTASLFELYSYTGAEMFFDADKLGWGDETRKGNGYARLRGQTVRPVSD